MKTRLDLGNINIRYASENIIDNTIIERLKHNVISENTNEITVASISRMLSGFNSVLNLYINNKNNNNLYRALMSYNWLSINLMLFYRQVLIDQSEIMLNDVVEDVFNNEISAYRGLLEYRFGINKDDILSVNVLHQGKSAIIGADDESIYIESSLMQLCRLVSVYFTHNNLGFKSITKDDNPFEFNYQLLFNEWLKASDTYDNTDLHKTYKKARYTHIIYNGD